MDASSDDDILTPDGSARDEALSEHRRQDPVASGELSASSAVSLERDSRRHCAASKGDFECICTTFDCERLFHLVALWLSVYSTCRSLVNSTTSRCTRV